MNRQDSLPGMLFRSTQLPKRQALVRVMRFALATLLLQFLVSPLILAGQDKINVSGDKLCYAFLRQGDLWTVCQGKREHIALGGKAFEFAVSADGSFLAIVKTLSWSAQKELIKSKSNLISLNTPFKTTATETESSRLPDLRATCGTILIYNGDGTAIDMLSGKPLSFSPSKVFHCSSDRRVIAGWDSTLTVEFSRGFYPAANLSVRVNGAETEQRPIYMGQGQTFDVSPNGEYLAYFRVASIESPESIQLCSMKIASQPACVEEDHAEGSNGISLSNLGSVLYTAETEGECFYKDEQHPSRKRLPGYSERGPCNGIYFWRPGMQSSVLLEDFGRHPQWISPDVAAKLHQWSLKTVEKPKEP